MRPTCHFYEPLWKKFKDTFKYRGGQIIETVKKRFNPSKENVSATRVPLKYSADWSPDPYPEMADKNSDVNPHQGSRVRGWARIRKTVSRLFKKNHFISDLSLMDLEHCRCMMDIIRVKGQESGRPEIPIVLENHTKDLHDFSYLDSFFQDLACADDVEIFTLTDLALALKQGRFQISIKEGSENTSSIA